MEVDEIVVLVDELVCQKTKGNATVRYVIKLQGYQFCCHSYLSISQTVFDHKAFFNKDLA